ncbi:MAG: hypothetical protein JSV65_05300 [Armatimonadota bacterium]|nr:MAG: hypothetical protein JSV65_05300 [Armatimonadota bacterium]
MQARRGLLVAVLCAVALAAGCGGGQIPPELIGSWRMVQSGEEVAHLGVGDQTFNADGTWHGQETNIYGGSLPGKEYQQTGTFEVKGDQLIITRDLGGDKVPIPLYFEVNGDTLTTRWQLDEHGADTSVVYQRVK